MRLDGPCRQWSVCERLISCEQVLLFRPTTLAELLLLSSVAVVIDSISDDWDCNLNRSCIVSSSSTWLDLPSPYILNWGHSLIATSSCCSYSKYYKIIAVQVRGSGWIVPSESATVLIEYFSTKKIFAVNWQRLWTEESRRRNLHRYDDDYLDQNSDHHKQTAVEYIYLNLWPCVSIAGVITIISVGCCWIRPTSTLWDSD